jgi:hypothetical protein
MTTSIKVHVNGRYRATVRQDSNPPVIVEGNYAGSPNPSGERAFHLPHPAHSHFSVIEEYVPELKFPTPPAK